MISGLMDVESKHERMPEPATSRTQLATAAAARLLSVASLIVLFVWIFHQCGGITWKGITFFNAVSRSSRSDHIRGQRLQLSRRLLSHIGCCSCLLSLPVPSPV